jgi:hypothetical protein
MIEVKEVLKVDQNTTVLICDLFADDEIRPNITSNIGPLPSFVIEEAKHCFSNPKTRNVILFGNDDYSAIKEIQFV